MKKRSVLSAVAMLLVSALVLTSATYAWFAAGATASVSAITTTVNGSDNSIVLSADGGTDWFSTLTEALITSESTVEKFPSEFTPIDWNGSDWMAGVLQGSDFSMGVAPAGSTSYLYYTFNVKSLSSDDVEADITPAITFADDFVYVMIEVTDGNGTTTTIYNSDTTAYNALELDGVAVAGTAIDVDSDGVIEATDTLTDIVIGDPITPTTLAATGTIAIDVPGTTSGGSASVSVWMWAEGQDYDCHGSASGSDASIALSIA